MKSVDDLPERALIPEVAQVLRASPRFVSNECASGRLHACKIAGRYQITREAVRAYLTEREAEAETPAAPALDLHDDPPVGEQNVSAWTEWVDLALDQLRGCRSLGAIQIWEEDNRSYLDDLAQQDSAGRNRITATIEQVKMQLRGQGQ